MHNSSLIPLIIFVITGLVVLNALTYYSERFKIFPSVVWVLCLGLLYGAMTRFELVDLPDIDLNPNFVLFIIVPVLIFASTKKMCLYHFRRVVKESSILATFGIVVSMVGIALVLYVVFNVPFLESLLFGVIISATDPIAVSAILHEAKDLSIEKKMLIEGESILNDGFVVAVFATLTAIIFESSEITLILSSGKLVVNILGAIVLGILMGRLARFLLRLWKNKAPSLTINITLALAFASFLLAESFNLPGVLSVFSGALAFGYIPDKDDEIVKKAQEQVWDYMEYIMNSILFFWLGVGFFTQASQEIITVTVVVSGVIMLFVSRFIALIVLRPLLHIEKEKMTNKDFWLLNFSGSRGAISIALILLLPNDFSYKPLFLTIGFIMVLFSLIVYPIILKKILD